MNRRRTLRVAPSDAGVRLDLWLSRRLPDLSRSRIQALLKAGHVTVDGEPGKGARTTRAGARVQLEIPPPAAAGPLPEAIPLRILHEDAQIIVLDKPAGLVVHPAAGHRSGTLVNALLHHCPDLPGIGGELRPGIVHRLDKDTSGVMVVAKTDRAMAGLADQFKRGRILKHYLAVVWGRPGRVSGRIQTLIGRSRSDRKKMSARPSAGRTAVTRYRLAATFRDMTLATVWIRTGRTHQIRVHMAHMGHPVVGDRQYGTKRSRATSLPVSRQMLHARHLRFEHPATGERVGFKAQIPADMAELLRALRADAGARTGG